MESDARGTGAAPAQAGDQAPERAQLVLLALIVVAGVANLNLSVANVALPDIGEAFDSSQTTLNLIAVGYSLGLAASVLWFGALGDRYGRKLMIVLGMGLSIPASLLAGFAPSDEVLFVARVAGGLSAGMAYPTTLALITALWSGAARTKAIALWSALGGGIAALGPLVSGALLEHFDWGSVFLVTLPLAVLALLLAISLVPAHVNESTEPVDNIGGLLSAFLVGGLVIAINFLPVPGEKTLALSLLAVAIVTGVLFFVRQRRAENPLYDLRIAARPTFWVAGLRRNHRLRLADGRDVREPAVPPERPRLLDDRRRGRDPPGGRLHGPRGAALGQARAGKRLAPDALDGPGAPPGRVRADARSLDRTTSRTGRSRCRSASSAPASASRARPRRTR